MATALVVMFAGLFLCLLSTIFLDRNNQVRDYRKGLLGRIAILANEDAANNRNWEWRYEKYNEVGYDEMLFKFWKSFDSFYLDKSFLE